MKVRFYIYYVRSGIEEYEKNSLNFVSEYLNTYITDLLVDSKNYALSADRNKINIDDVK
jgi:hypothetical protein